MTNENDLKKDEKISILPKISESFGGMLKRMRAEKGLTLEQVSQSTGVNKSTIQRYENGKIINMSQALLEKLSELYNYDLLKILEGDFTKQGEEQEEPIVVEPLAMDEETQAQNLQDVSVYHAYLQLNMKREILTDNPVFEKQLQKIIKLAGYLHQDDLETVIQLMQSLKQKNSNYLRFVNEILKRKEEVLKVERVSFYYDEGNPESKEIHCAAACQQFIMTDEEGNIKDTESEETQQN